MKRDYSTLGASWLVITFGLAGSQINCRNRVEALNRNRQTLEENRRFTRIIGDKRKTMAQRRKKITTSSIYRPKVSKASGKKRKFDELAAYLSSFREAAASAAKPAVALLSTLHSNRTPPRCQGLWHPTWHNVFLAVG